LTAHLHLHRATAVALDPARELLAQLLVAVAREPAAAVDLDRFPHWPEQPGELHAEQFGLEIPERRVDCGDGIGAYPAPTDVAHPRHHLDPELRDRERIAAANDLREFLQDKRGD